MSTHAQDRDFKSKIISDTLLEDSIEWIQSNMNPDDVFSESQLSDWAKANGFTEAE